MNWCFEKIDEHFEKIDECFEKIDDHFEKVDKCFNKMNEEFKQQHIYMNQCFEKIDEHFDRMNQQFKRVDIQFEEMQIRQLNSMCSKAYESIYAIVKIETSDETLYLIQISRYFLKNIEQFWRLKSLSHDKFECIDSAFPHWHQSANMETIENKLIYLIRFYKIQDYKDWETFYDAYMTEQLTDKFSSTDDSSDLEKSIMSELTLNNIIRQHFNNVLQTLTEYLSLIYRDVMQCINEMKQHW